MTRTAIGKLRPFLGEAGRDDRAVRWIVLSVVFSLRAMAIQTPAHVHHLWVLIDRHLAYITMAVLAVQSCRDMRPVNISERNPAPTPPAPIAEACYSEQPEPAEPVWDSSSLYPVVDDIPSTWYPLADPAKVRAMRPDDNKGKGYAKPPHEYYAENQSVVGGVFCV